MKAPQDIILAPVITEASMMGLAAKKYTFRPQVWHIPLPRQVS